MKTTKELKEIANNINKSVYKEQTKRVVDKCHLAAMDGLYNTKWVLTINHGMKLILESLGYRVENSKPPYKISWE